MPITGPSIFFSSSFAKLVARKARAATLHMVLPARRPKAEDMRPNICCWSPHGCSVCQRVGYGLMELYRSYMIFNHSPSNHVDLYPGPCSARLLTCTTNLTLAPLSSCCRKVRSFYGSLLSQNCCGEMAGSADLPVAPKLAQFSVDKCGQIWDNANRYTKYIKIQDMRRDMLQYVTYVICLK